MVQIAELSSLLVNSEATEHRIKINDDEVLSVWVKELSFMQMQQAIKSFVKIGTDSSIDIDLAQYWKYMFAEAIDRTEPRLSIPQMLSLRSDVALQITSLLPQPQDLMANPLVDGATE